MTAGATATFTGGGGPAVLDPGLLVSDVDSGGTLASATVTIGAGYHAGDTLNFTNNGTTEGNIAGSYANGVLVLTSAGNTATLAQWDAALQSVTYSFTAGGDPTIGGTDTTRTISWVVNDGVANSTAVTSTLDTVHVAPTVTAGATATFTGGGGPAVLDPGLLVSDVDSGGTLASATVTIGAGYHAGDTLNFTNNGTTEGNIAGSYANGVLVLTSAGNTATLAQWDAALQSVTYSFTAGGDPTIGGTDTTRTISWVVNDGVANSTAVTSTLDTVHVAPTVTAGATATFTGGGGPAVLDPGLLVSDVDSGGTLASATVTIGAGYHAGDTLNFTNNGTTEGNIAGSYANGVLVLTSAGNTATLAQWDAALQSVTYSFTAGGDPTIGGTDTTRTISWVVNDGVANSTAVTSTLDTVHVAPTVTAGATATFTGGGGPAVLDPGLLVSDVDSGGTLASATVTIGAGYHAGDTLNFTNNGTTEGNIAGSYANGVLVLTSAGNTATLAQWDAALQSVTYSFTAGGDPTIGGTDTTRTISWVVNDGVANSTAVTSTLDTVHVAPTVTAGATATFTGGGGPAVLDPGLLVSDVDSGGTLASATVTIGAGYHAGDTLNFTNNGTTEGNIAGSYANGVLVLTSAGNTATLAQWDAALQSVTYSFTAGGDPTIGGTDTTRTISWVVNDGVANSTAVTSTLDTVHVAPTVTAGATATFTGGGGPAVLDPGLLVSDVDSGGTLASATVTIGAGYHAGDTLNFTNNGTTEGNIAGSYANGVLVLTSAGNTATLAQWDAALQSVTYSFTAGGDPTIGGTDTTRTISWVVNDGVANSTAVTSTLDTVHVAPTVTAGATATFTGGGGPAVLDPGLLVSDVDSGGTLASATVTIGAGYHAGDTLNFTNNGTTEGNIAGSYANGVLVLTSAGNTATLAQWDAALQSVTYSFTAGGDPTIGGTDTTRTISWVVNDGVANSTAVTSTLDTVHVAPTVTAGATATFTGGGGPAVLDPGLLVSDVDSGGTLASATVTIGAGYHAGDTLNFTNNGTTEGNIAGSYANGVLVLTSAGNTATLAQWDAALQSVTYSFTAGGDPTIGGTDTTRTISWVVNDGVANSTAVTSTLDTVHVAPTVTAGATATFTGGGGPAVLDPGLLVSDVDSGGTLASATVTIGAGYHAGDTLNFTNNGTTEGNIAGSYANGVLVLTSAGNTATLAQWDAALQSVTYSFTAGGDPTIGGTDTTRTISWVVNDGVANSTAVTSTLDTVHVAPTVTAGATATFTGGGGPAVLDPGLLVSDVDSGGTLASATVTIGAGYHAGDTLNFTNNGTTEGNIAGSYANGVLVLTSAGNTATLAQWDAALQSVTYSFTAGGDPTIGGTDTTRTISWVVNDGVANSTAVTSTLDTVHVAPTVTAGATATFTGGGGPAVLDPGLLVSDVDSGGTLASATVTIGAGYHAGDTLNFTNNGTTEGNIAGSYANGVLVLTSAGNTATLAQWDAALQSVTYSFTAGGDPTIGGTDTTRTISWVVNDGVANSTAVTSTLDTVHVAPTVTAGATATFTGGGGPAVLDPGLLVSDVDSGGTLASATVTIGAGYHAGDTLNFTNNGTTEGNIAGSYANGVLVLTSAGNTATLAQWDAALQSVTYSFTAGGDPTIGGTDTTRTISWVVNDGVANSTAVTSTLDTVHVAPTVTAGATATFTGGGGPAVLDPGLLVSDVDSGGTLASATVTIGAGYHAGDTLNFTNNGTTEGNIAGSYANGVLVLTSAGNTATLAQWDAALQSVTYSFTAGGDPTIGGTDTTRTISWVVNDGVANSTAVTSTLDTVHVAPTVTAGATATFTGGGGPAVLDPGLLVSDVDSGGTLASATVTIGAGYHAGDTLNFTNNGTTEGNIAGSYANGVLVLTSAGNTATLAQWDAALQSVTYSFTAGGDPTIGGTDTTRTISWVVNDGVANSTAVTSTLDTVHVAPTVTAGATATFTGGGGPAVLDPGLLVSDVDSGGTLASATVTIGAGYHAGDTLNFTNNGTTEGNIAGSYANGVLVLTSAGNTATLAQWDAALQSVTYSFTAGGDPTIGGTDTTRTISWVVNDGVANSTAVTSTLDTVHVAPTVTAGATATFTGGGGPAVLDPGLLVSDVDSGGTLASATVTIGAGYHAGDTLNFTNNGTTEGNIAGSYANGVLVLTSAGNTATLAQWDAALQSVTYSFTAGGDPTIGGTDTTRTISWVVNDGVANSTAVTSTLDTVHVAPTVTAGATATFTGGGGPAVLDPGLLVSDVDSGGTLASATVTIGAGYHAGDTLNFTNNGTTEGNIAGSYANGVLVLTSAGNTATLAQWDAALQSVTYSFTAGGDPTIGGTDITRTISWVVNDGVANSTAVTSTLDTVHVAPTVTAGATATFTGGGGPAVLDPGLLVSDVDSGGTLASATVTIGAGYHAGDTLNFTNNGTTEGNIAGSYANGVLVLTSAGNTATLAQWDAALQSVTYSFTAGGDPTIGGTDTTRTISWVVNDGVANSTAVTSTLDTVHVAPTVTAGATATFTGGGGPAVLDPGLLVSDVDSGGTLASATVTIGAGYHAGDTLNFTNNGTTEGNIAGSYANGVLVLTSAGNTATLAQWDAALQSVTYSFTAGGDPTIGGTDTTRTISWVVNDGVANSTAVTSTLDTVHVAPTVTAGATATFTGGGGPAVLDPGLLVSDVDSGGTLASATVTIGAGYHAGDTLNFTNNGTTEGNIAGSYANGVLVLTSAGNTATLAQWDAALQSVTYSFTAGGDPTIGGTDTTRTISWQVTDGSANSTAVTSTLDTVHVAPTVTAGATATFTGGGGPPCSSRAAGERRRQRRHAGQRDGDDRRRLPRWRHAELHQQRNDRGNIAGSYANGVLVLTSAGNTATLAQWDAALQSVTYSFTAGGDPTIGGTDTTRTISWVVNDGVANSTAVTSTLDTVHVAPTVTAGATATFTGGGGPAVLDPGLLVSDVDSGGTLASATVTIGAGYHAGDTLNFTNNGTTEGNIAGSYANGVLVLTSAGNTATLAQWDAALQSVTYSFTAEGDPTIGGTDTRRTISWVVNDGGRTRRRYQHARTVHVAPTVAARGSPTFSGGGGRPCSSRAAGQRCRQRRQPGQRDGEDRRRVPRGDTLNFTQNGMTRASQCGQLCHGVLALTRPATPQADAVERGAPLGHL